MMNSVEAVNLQSKKCERKKCNTCVTASRVACSENILFEGLFLNVFFLYFQFCCLATTLAQYDGPAPPRLNIPGAIPLPAHRPNQQGRAVNGPIKVRRPNRPQPVVTEARFIDEAKPVNEETEDEYNPQQQHHPSPPSPPRALFTSEPQEFHQPEVPSNAQRFNIERPRAAQPRPQQQAQPQSQRPRAQNFDEQRQRPHHADDKPKKPVAQILRKYREENPDGTIVWGFENDDGSFKEETIGIDCITRGIYGYIDPDGEKRVRKTHFNYAIVT